MSHIQNIRSFTSKDTNKHALVMCGFGGSIWQVKRLIRTLIRDGYNVTALDFSKHVLSSGDINHLIELTNEITAFAEEEYQKLKQPILLVGISLGALMALNILRRSKHFSKGVLITGGDIVKIARKVHKQAWPMPINEHMRLWQDVNMYTNPTLLKNKKLLFVLPKRDVFADIVDVRREASLQQAAGNTLIMVERPAFGHIGTIIEETILFPGRTIGYIERL
jgi:esterase/lipase